MSRPTDLAPTTALPAAALGAGFATTAAYLIATWSAPQRPFMLFATGALLVIATATWLCRRAVPGADERQPLFLVSMVAHLAGCGLLTFLDGGVAGPLGPLAYLTLPYLAVRAPARTFTAFAAVAVAVYATVALAGPSAPAGYAFVHTAAFVGVSVWCARHARLLVRLARRLAEVTRVDPLTGCLNRRGFDERLAQELSRASRTHAPVTLVVLRPQAFDRLLERDGSEAVDHLMAGAAHSLLAAVRAQDAVGRIDDDRFAVLVTDAGPGDLGPVITRLRRALRPIEADAGWASFPTDAAAIESLHHVADRALGAARSARTDVLLPTDTGVAAPKVVESERLAVVPRASPVDRRRRAVSDVGKLTTAAFALGLTYALRAMPSGADRTLSIVLLTVGLALGAGLLAGAGALARSRSTAAAVTAATAVQLAVGVASAALDGGVGSPLALGILVPLPLITLTAPSRALAPVVTWVGLLYLGLALAGGSPGGWYTTMHLAGVLAVALACAGEGRLAAHRRSLLMDLSRTDSLTECLNRRGFEERFAAAIVHAERRGEPVSLLLVDLEGFRRRNDAHGRAAADELLCWVASSIADLLRAHDAVGRIGLDEFAVLLADCPLEETARITERVREALAPRTSVATGSATLRHHGHDVTTLHRHAATELRARKPERRAAPARIT